MQRDDMFRAVKATGIVALLGAVGGVIGGLLVSIGAAIVALITVRPHITPIDLLVGFGLLSGVSAAIGAAYGTVLGPLLSWTLLRRVPLWRAIIEPAIVAALTVGTVLSLQVPSGLVLFAAPVITSGLAAVRLRLATDRALARGSQHMLPPT